MRVCASCGEHNPDRARFCLNCAAALEGSTRSSPEVRKTVTIVFTDVAGSTTLAEKLDPESIRRVMSSYFEAVQPVIERHGGTVEKFIGDAVMAVFGIPVIHEDDALRAVRAAAQMREAVEELNRELEHHRGVHIETRTGVNTGEVVAGDSSRGQVFASGDAVNVAARLEQNAAPGEILLSESTYYLVRDAVVAEPVGPLDVRGKDRPIIAYSLQRVLVEAEAVTRRLNSPLVGRDKELTALLSEFEKAVAGRECRLCTIVGTSGVGKSRLTAEFLERISGRGRVARGHCLPYGEGITFWPVKEMIEDLAGVADDHDAETARRMVSELTYDLPDSESLVEPISAIIGLSDVSVDSREAFWSVRRLLETLAQKGPLIVVFDDIHWAEPTFLNLVEYLAGFVSGVPLMIVCVARPELSEVRPEWGSTLPNSVSVSLYPLGDSESAALIANLLGSGSVPTEMCTRIVEAADGNPLFVEEMVRMLIDEGSLRQEDGRWSIRPEAVDIRVPPTIQALLAARLDRLQHEEKAVIQRASIVGRVFWWGAIADLSPEDEKAHVGTQLQSLMRRELILPDATSVFADDAFRFSHILIRDVAYRSVPKELRADLHQRFAEWLERTAGERLPEYEEILGYHLEQAHRYLTALGPSNERNRRLAIRAAGVLRSAGYRAFRRNDAPAAVALLGRAAELLDTDDPERSTLLPDLGRALVETGDLQKAAEIFEEAIELGRAGGLPEVETRGRLERTFLQQGVDPGVDEEYVRVAVLEAISACEKINDVGGLARAWHVLGQVDCWLGRSEDGERHLWTAVGYARKADDAHQETESLGWICICLFSGPTPAVEGIAKSEEIGRMSSGSIWVAAWAMQSRAIFEAMLGNFREARRLMNDGREMIKQLGLKMSWAASAIAAGSMELIFDPVESERVLREGLTALSDMGETGYLSSVAGLLAEALYQQGRYQEADEMAQLCRSNAGGWDVEAQRMWRTSHAKILARRGKFEEAEALAREAVALIDRTDYLDERADTYMALGEVLELEGRTDEAVGALRQALELYGRKGATYLVDTVKGHLAALRYEG